MKHRMPPESDSIQELAAFWDTHDLTDFEPCLEEVEEPLFVRAKRASLSIDLPRRETGRVRNIARSKGLDETTLLRQWVLEKLEQYAAHGRSTREAQPRRPGRKRT